MKPKFALVQWIRGEYDATYTAGIPVEWIMDFDVNKFDPKTEPEDHSYVVQWRESKSGRMPKRGWRYYDAKVVQVSRRIKSLENQIQILEGAVSPLRLAAAERELDLPDGINLESTYDMVEEVEEVESNLTSTSTGKTKTKKRKEKGDNEEAEGDYEDERRPKKKKKKKELSHRKLTNQFEDDSIPELLATPFKFRGTNMTSYSLKIKEWSFTDSN
ncbi:uncharacterized protein LOC141535032 isoform X2 [Cotesia typhae]|uniref:uncharacterized protein LOC141535032 isoform X2 n=1 Tax=Cotesia typhae TaxID=2053667 RepID=UPI003D68B326